MNNLLKKLSEQEKGKLKKKEQPEWTSPMLAKLSHEIFSDKNWIYERKLDGERILIFKKGNKISLKSRNKKELNKTYPEIEEAIKNQELKNFIIDGEVVAFDGKFTSFSKLQTRMHLKDPKEVKESKTRVFFYAFDIVYLEDYDLSKIGLTHRKAILKEAVEFKDPLRFTPHRNENGEKYHTEACKKGWEGLIAKKADSEYLHKRSSNWLKLKCVNQQEFVIGGYTDPEGERVGFGALLIGFYENGALQYAGKVGTGYDDKTLEDLHQKLSKIEKEDPEFEANGDLPSKKVHWVKPKYVAEIGFTEWTNTNKLRHPRYLGLRRSKKPGEVIREN
ncbi:MAG: non-homologous end-joining DNA ligase [Bacteroidota bacterium]